MIGLVALAGLATLLLGHFVIGSASDRDIRAIGFERAKRRMLADWGAPLPGTPDLANLQARLAEKGVEPGAPVLVRIFKREFELELWMEREGRFEPFVTYPICRWSGRLGPKLKQGDAQAPEGFYAVGKDALNPNSRWYRSFNVGYPNAFDQSLGRTGSLIMVHGGCASVGCFAMTNAQMDEIWRLVTAALDHGQKAFQVQVFPFRLSEENLKAYEGHPDLAFWRDLKTGYDLFEATRQPPGVRLCLGRYEFDARSEASGEGGGTLQRCAPASAKN